MTLPAWASGPEWEGWEIVGSNHSQVCRKASWRPAPSELGDTWIIISLFGTLRVGYDSIRNCPSPESALRIANAIAAEFGGWA
jgi:hypothetical protein